jgi:uncharacterized protein
VRLAFLALACAAFVAACAAPLSAKEPPYPEPTGYVVDGAGLLAPETRDRLTAIARELDEKTKVQLAVAIVPSIAPLTVEEYAVRLFARWGVGGKEKDEGVLFVLARDERRVRIEVGYGLEGLLPDGRVGGILRNAVVPHLKRDDWNAGITRAVESIASLVAVERGVTLASLEGVSGPPPEEETVRNPAGFLVKLLGMMIAFMLISAMAGVRGSRRFRRRGFWIGPGGSGGFGGGGFGGWSGGGGGGGGGFGGFSGGSSGGGGASSGF